MINFPNCKLNLGLFVISKRTDGFHNIETVMIPVNITDILEIIISPVQHFTFNITGIEISGDIKDNLVVRAYELLKVDFNLPPVEIHLHKIIPAGAGLGGGSADAAFTIRMINTLFRLNLTHQKMEDYARQLGSDCAFFIANKPVIAHGKGDEFEAIDVSPENCFITIVKPEIAINTREAYSLIKPAESGRSLRQIIKQPVEQWRDVLVNDFEKVLFPEYSAINAVKEKLYDLGAVYSSMTGSGSAVYGIFRKPAEVKNQFPGCMVFPNCKLIL